ncbi:hypothetical protein FOA52_003649 [Chlamydomonas sp. UWO 241]|nr:hypothetical protein FOA52_003649 [Chlamydomonas sp. UWO 241]
MFSAATAAGPPRRSLPKVPSQVFDLELHDHDWGTAATSVEELDTALVLAELKRFFAPCSAMVTRDVHRCCSPHAWDAQNDGAVSVATLADGLSALKYGVAVRRAVGGGDGAECLHNLRHTHLLVTAPGAPNEPFVVDPTFVEQFRIAKPTSRYTQVLECVPCVLVLPESQLVQLVHFMCIELANAFKASDAVIPPWRKLSSMLSKWLPRRAGDSALPRANPGAHHAEGGHAAHAHAHVCITAAHLRRL